MKKKTKRSVNNMGLLCLFAAQVLSCSTTSSSVPLRTASSPERRPPEARPQPAAEFSVAHVVVFHAGSRLATVKRSRTDALQRAREVLAKARSGADFGGLARRYSDSPSRERGGILMPISSGQILSGLEPLLEAARKTQVGQIYPRVIESVFGFHVLMRRPLKKIVVRQIMLTYAGSAATKKVGRSKEQAHALAKQLRAKVAEGASIADLARQHSDDDASKAGSGRLGPFAEGVMTPVFERAAFALAVGQLAPVLETRFGYHVIKRVE